jgi:5-dehydro-2-deoxygluconokinase
VGQAALYDLITMGRSLMDLYSNDIGAPFVEIKSFTAYVGGSPTNIAVGAHRLGLKSALLTAVGPDLVGDFILNFLQKEGIETRYIQRKPGTRTSAVLLGIEPPDRYPLVYYRDNAADKQLTIQDVQATPITDYKVFEFAGTNLSEEPCRTATLYAVEQARAAEVTVIMDLDFRTDQWQDPRAYGLAVRAILPSVDVVLGTEQEVKAAMLVDESLVQVSYSQVSSPEVAGDVGTAVEALLKRGPRLLVLKVGAEGCVLYPAGSPAEPVPGFPVEVYNLVGAGDAFASGFIYGYLQGWSLYRSARLANACGAIVVTRHACSNATPYLEEAYQFIEQHGGF